MSADKRDVLRRVPTFASLADADLDAVLAVLKARRGNAGDVLFREGDRGDSLMIVLDGQLVARVKTDAGGEEEIARLGPGEIVGEMAFVDAEPRSATIATVTGATVLDFTRAALAHLQQTAPRVAAAIQRNLLRDVARRLRDAGEKLSEGAPSQGGKADAEASRAGRTLTAAQLRTIPALASYANEDLELLAYVAQLRKFEARTNLVVEGAEGDSCFLVVSGSVEVHRRTAAESLAVLGPGALVGQLALLDRAPRSASVTAREETLALEIRAAAFANLVAAHSPIALRFQIQVARAGVKQLRLATKKLANVDTSRASTPPNSLRMLDDWDSDDDESAPLELAAAPRSRRP